MIRLACGSAWWGDRISPAADVAEHGDLDFLCFETMAESTVSAAQVKKRHDPNFPGYDTWLDDRMHAVLPHCLANQTRIVSNQGWIDPVAAAKRIKEIATDLGAVDFKVAAVTGSDLTPRISTLAGEILETGKPFSTIEGQIVSAEAYVGALPIAKALDRGADVVVTGRVTDPAIFLGPLIHSYGWKSSDWQLLGHGTGIGHLLECGAQVTGGYFSDPGFKDVPQPWNLGFPIADVDADGTCTISKLPGTGGLIDRHTVLEQMFYEVHDPANYLTADVVVDFTTAEIEEISPDRVRVSNIGGKPKTGLLKVSIGAAEGFIGEDMFFYAGPGAVERANLACEVLRERFKIVDLKADELRIERLGVDAIHRSVTPELAHSPYEVGVRVAGRTKTRAEALKIGREVDGMAVSGIAHTGKRVPFGERVREVVGIWSTLVAEEEVSPEIHFV